MTPRFLILAAVLVGCATPPVAAEPQAATVTLDAITAPARPGAVASRVAPPPTITVAVAEPPVPTLPPFDCATVRYIVNQLPFEVMNPEPMREAYRLITEVCRGWSAETIARWETFAVDDVPIGESVGCPLVRGGATGVVGLCVIGRQGTREDTGAYQLTRPFYEYPHGIVCVSDGYCSSESILASPFDSINAGLAAIEQAGKHPWCFADWARRLHWSCANTPRYWP